MIKKFTKFAVFFWSGLILILNSPTLSAANFLGQGPEVRISPAIQALANDLGNDPVQICRFVKNEIRMEPYFGATKDAEATLIARRGNDTDQATLLIALLRTSGIPARYVTGRISVTSGQLANWFRVDGSAIDTVVKDIYGALLLRNGGLYEIPHVWVEAYLTHDDYRGVPSSSNRDWIPLDPGFETNQIEGGGSVTIYTPPDQPPAGSFTYDIEDWLIHIRSDSVIYDIYRSWRESDAIKRRGLIDKMGTEYLKQKEVLPFLPNALPLYKIVSVEDKLEELTDPWRVLIEIWPQKGKAAATIPMAMMGGRPLILTYEGATEADQRIINNAGGILNVPASTGIRVIPILKANGQVVWRGQVSSLGQEMDGWIYPVTGAFPQLASEEKKREQGQVRYLKVGNVAAIFLEVYATSDIQVQTMIQEILSESQKPSPDESLLAEKLVELVPYTYAWRKYENFRAMEKMFDGRFIGFDLDLPTARTVMAYAEGRFEGSFERALGKNPQVIRFNSWSNDWLVPQYTSTQFRNFQRLFSFLGSSLEHQIFMELFGVPAMSTVIGFQIAHELGIPIHKIYPDGMTDGTVSNAAQIIPLLQYPQNKIDEFQTALDKGSVLEVPERPIKIGSTEFVAYFEGKPAFTNQTRVETKNDVLRFTAWLGTLNGGYGGFFGPTDGDPYADPYGGYGTGMNPTDAYGTEYYCVFYALCIPGGTGPTAGPGPVSYSDPVSSDSESSCTGEPVNVVNGAMWHTFNDLTINGSGIPLEFYRTYAARSGYSGPMGYGWTHNYNLRLTSEDGGIPEFGKNIIFTDEWGTQRTFVYVSQVNAYASGPHTRAQLTLEANGYGVKKRDGFRYSFDVQGRLRRIENRTGNQLVLTYNNKGELEGVIDDLGRFLSFTYNGDHRIEVVTDFDGRRVEFDYDGNGDLSESRDLAGRPTTYDYLTGQANPALNHNLIQFTLPNGESTEYTYYMDDRLEHHLEPEGKVTSYFYDWGRFETRVTNAQGQNWYYRHNRQGLITEFQDPDGQVVNKEYDGLGNVMAVVDEQGRRTEFNYDIWGNKTYEKDVLGYEQSWTYDNFGLVTSYRNRNGNLLEFVRDPANGNLLEERWVRDGVQEKEVWGGYDPFGRPGFRRDTRGKTTTYSYRMQSGNTVVTTTDPLGNSLEQILNRRYELVSVKDTSGFVTQNQFDQFGRIWRTTLPAGTVHDWDYDSAGNVTFRRVYPQGGGAPAVWGYEYDGLGNLSAETDPLGNRTEYNYEIAGCSCGSEEKVTQVVDPLGNVTRYENNWRGKTVHSTDGRGVVQENRYDARGNLTRLIDGNGNKWNFEYDSLGRLTKEIKPDSKTTRYTYDPNGNLETKALPSGKVVTYTYNEQNQLRTKTTADNITSSTYDPYGNLLYVKDNDSEVFFDYDDLGRLERTRYRFGGSLGEKIVERRYYSNGWLRQIIDPEGNITEYRYNPRGLLETVTSGGEAFTYTYDPFARSDFVTNPNSTTTNFAYDPLSRLAEVRHDSPTTGVLAHQTYSYSQRGDVETKTTDYAYFDHPTGQMARESGNFDYHYDPIGQLTNILYTPRAQPWPKLLESYRYDANQNLYPAIVNMKGDVSYNNSNVLGKWQGISFSSDTDGNRKTGQGRYTYDVEGRLTLYNFGSGEESYAYDGLGRRLTIAPRGGTRRYLVYDRNTLIAEYDSNGNLLRRYVHGLKIDDPLAIIEGGEFYVYHEDALGSVVALTNSSGNLVETYRYDSFGKPLDITWDATWKSAHPFKNPFRYTAREVNGEIYYYRNRYYDPHTRRFLTEDPLRFVDGINRYAYARNRPMSLIDPFGWNSWQYDNATDTLSYIGDDGHVIQSWPANSGPWGNGQLPPGDYTLNGGPSAVPPSHPDYNSYCDGSGNCWWQPITPNFETNRDGLGIHPDGGTAGTAGCIGATNQNTQDIYNTLNNNPGLPLNVR